MTKTSTKARTTLHASDASDAAKLAQAKSFITTLFLGTGKFDKRPTETIEQAAAAREELKRANPMCTRKPMVYAILADGSQVMIPDAQIAAMQAPAARKGYSKKANAQRAAAAAGLDIKWLDFVQTDAGWTWEAKTANATTTPAIAPTSHPAIKAVAFTPDATAEDFTPPAFLAKGATAAMSLTAMADKIAAGEKIDVPAPAAKPAKPARAAKPAKAEKPAAAADAPKAPRISAKHQVQIDAAQQGIMPTAPDFSAPTHARYRKRLAEVQALAEAGDVAGLKALTIKPIDSSLIPLDRYRNLAVMALEAKAAK